MTKIQTLIQQPRTIIKQGDEKHSRLLYDLSQAIESNMCYPWNLNLNYAREYPKVDKYAKSVAMKEIYCFHFESDEDAILRVVVFNGKDIAYVIKSGDTRHWHWCFYDKEVQAEFLAFLMEIESSLIEPIDEPPLLEQDEIIDCQYLDFTEVDGKVYINGFKGFASWLEPWSHPKEVVLADDTQQRLRVKKWIQPESLNDDANITVEQNGETFEIHLSKVLVELQHL